MLKRKPRVIRCDAKILKAVKPQDVNLYYEDIRPVIVEGTA